MSESRRVQGLTGLKQAFDEVRFGAARTLNLRASFPTARDAAARLDSWLRQQQAQKVDEVLVVTGRGNNSEQGISVVRDASLKTFRALRRKGVIGDFNEHTAGSFVVTLAPLTALGAAEHREPAPRAPIAAPPTLAALGTETRSQLRALAERSLDALGVRDRGPFLEAEMLRLFGSLAAMMPSGGEREVQLRAAIAAAMDEYD
jgi:hypothetical protein